MTIHSATIYAVCVEDIGNLTTRLIGGSTTLLFPTCTAHGPGLAHAPEFDELLIFFTSWTGGFDCCIGVVCPNA